MKLKIIDDISKLKIKLQTKEVEKSKIIQKTSKLNGINEKLSLFLSLNFFLFIGLLLGAIINNIQLLLVSSVVEIILETVSSYIGFSIISAKSLNFESKISDLNNKINLIRENITEKNRELEFYQINTATSKQTIVERQNSNVVQSRTNIINQNRRTEREFES